MSDSEDKLNSLFDGWTIEKYIYGNSIREPGCTFLLTKCGKRKKIELGISCFAELYLISEKDLSFQGDEYWTDLDKMIDEIIWESIQVDDLTNCEDDPKKLAFKFTNDAIGKLWQINLKNLKKCSDSKYFKMMQMPDGRQDLCMLINYYQYRVKNYPAEWKLLYPKLFEASYEL